MPNSKAIMNHHVSDVHLQKLERDIKEIYATSDVSTYHTPLPAIPQYLEHQQGVPEVGMLSATAVSQEFETVAQEIENLGKDLTDVAQRCVDMVSGLHTLIEEVKASAQHCRSEGARMFKQVESCSKAADEVREQLRDARKKLGIDNGI